MILPDFSFDIAVGIDVGCWCDMKYASLNKQFTKILQIV